MPICVEVMAMTSPHAPLKNPARTWPQQQPAEGHGSAKSGCVAAAVDSQQARSKDAERKTR